MMIADARKKKPTMPSGFQSFSPRILPQTKRFTRWISPLRTSLSNTSCFRSVPSCSIETNQGKILDGKAIAKQIRKELEERVNALYQYYAMRPGLAVVLVGNRKDSQTYVRNKGRFAKEVGLESFTHHLPESVTETSLLEVSLLVI